MTLIQSVSAQVRIINTESGLDENTVNSIYVSPNGLIYLGTGIGLSVFDGENIVNIKTNLNQSVRKIFPWHNDSLILVRDNGLSIISTKNYQFREFDFSDKYSYKIIDCAMGKNEIFTTGSDGLGRFSLSQFNFKILTGLREFTYGQTYSGRGSIAYSEKNNCIYVAHKKGLDVYQPYNYSLKKCHIEMPYDSLGCYNIESRDNEVVYKSDGKFIVYNVVSNQFKEFQIPSYGIAKYQNDIYYLAKKNLFVFDIENHTTDSVEIGESLNIFKIIKGSGNTVFAAGSNGLVVIDRNIRKPRKVENILPKNSNYELGLQKKISYRGKLYFNGRDGILEYDSANDVTRYIELDTTIRIKSVYSMIPFGRDQVIVLGIGGYCGFNLKTQTYYRLNLFSDSSERNISQYRGITGHYDDINQFLVLTFYRQPIYFINLKTKEEGTFNGNSIHWFRTVRSMLNDGNGNYYLGANGNDGMMYYNFLSKKGYYVSTSDFTKAGNNSALINQIIKYNGYIYLATADGVIKFNPKTKVLKQLTVNGKDYHDQVYGASIIDKQLYFSTRNTLCILGDNDNLLKLEYYENYIGAGIPFYAHGSINLMVGRHLYYINMPNIRLQPKIFISHIGFQNKWFKTVGLSSYVCPHHAGSIQILFGNDNSKELSNHLRVFYRFSGNTNWTLLNGSSIQTGNLDNGAHQLEYYSVYWGQKSDVKTFYITIETPWWASVWFYVASIIGIAILAVLFVRYRLQRREKNRLKQLSLVLETTENERSRISKDFHDSIGSKLSAIKIISENVNAGGNKELSAQLPELVDDVIADFRNVLHRIHPQPLEMYGLIPALNSLIIVYRNQFPSITFELEGSSEIPSLKKECEIHLYRICQELINNAIKHSGGNAISIGVLMDNSQLILSVSDNGKWKHAIKGNGLINSESRVNILGGVLEIYKQKDKGTEIKIILSLEGCSEPSSS